MKIGIVGAHGTGKTSLAKALSKELNLPLIQEQARGVIREYGVDINKLVAENDVYGITYFQDAIMHRQKISEQMESFISDRTTIDIAAYLELYTGSAMYKVDAIRNMINYDLVVRVPIEFPLVDDGERLTCPICQRVFDRILTKYLAEAMWIIKNKHITVTGTTEERMQQILRRLSEKDEDRFS